MQITPLNKCHLEPEYFHQSIISTPLYLLGDFVFMCKINAFMLYVQLCSVYSSRAHVALNNRLFRPEILRHKILCLVMSHNNKRWHNQMTTLERILKSYNGNQINCMAQHRGAEASYRTGETTAMARNANYVRCQLFPVAPLSRTEQSAAHFAPPASTTRQHVDKRFYQPIADSTKC